MAATEPIRRKEDIRKLLEYCLSKGQMRNYLIIVMGLHTALRISDILALKWGSVYNFDTRAFRGHICLEEKKTRKRKSIAINEHIEWALKRYSSTISKKSAETYLFPNNRGENKPVGRTQAYRIIRDTAADAGLEGRVSCHSLRKTFGYHAWQSGTPVVVLMDIYNHSSYDVTRRYLGVCQDDKDEVYLNLDFI